MELLYVGLPVVWLALIVWKVLATRQEVHQNVARYQEDIRMVLEKYDFDLIAIRRPTWRECFQSYPYDFVSPLTLLKWIPLELQHEATFKVAFSTNRRKRVEVWLQITKNNLNGKVKYDWRPGLAYFREVIMDLAY